MNIAQLAPTIEKFFITSGTNSVFFEIGIIIIIATVFAFMSKRLKQPLIPAYIITGLLIGPVYGLITNSELITTLPKMTNKQVGEARKGGIELYIDVKDADGIRVIAVPFE